MSTLRRLFGGGGGGGGGKDASTLSRSSSSAGPDAPPPPPPPPAYDGLDLCYVTTRLIVCGRPSARATDLGDHRNNLSALSAFLSKRHGSDFLLFNLSNKNRNVVDYGKLSADQVLEYQPFSPLGVVDDAPAFSQTFRILYSLAFWLAWGPETVAVLFCNNGVYRSGFIAACFLRYSGAVASIDEGLAHFTAVRFPPQGGAPLPEQPQGGGSGASGGSLNAAALAAAAGALSLAPPPPAGGTGAGAGSIAPKMYASWRFLQRHLEAAMAAPPTIPRVHKLSFIIVALPGLCAGGGGGGGDSYPVVQLYQGPKVAFDSALDCAPEDTVRWEDGKLIVELPPPGLNLCGDYQLWLMVAGARARLTAHASFESAPTPNMGGSSAPGLAAVTDDEDAGGGGGTPAETDGGGDGRLQPRAASGAGGAYNRAHLRRRSRRLVARLLFHSNVLESGVVTFGEAECDLFHPKMERRAFALSLVLDEVPPEVVNESNLACVCKRSFINLAGDKALAQGAVDLSAHHYVFPDAKLRQQLTGEGLDDVAVVCALQRAGNSAGRAREHLDVALFKTLFKESAAMRDLKLLRDTLTLDEIAGVLAARSDMVVKRKGLQLGDLDFSSLLEAAKLGNLREDGAGGGGGGGPGGGGGGRGGGGRRRRAGGKTGDKSGKAGREGEAESSSGSEKSRAASSGSAPDDDAEELDAAEALAGRAAANGAGPKLFEDDAAARDDSEADNEEEAVAADDEEGDGEAEEWTLREHPIFGRFFKLLLGDKKPKSEVAAEMAKDAFNPALLDCDPDAFVPDGLAAFTLPIKDCELLRKYTTMLKVGLPRPVVEHKMISEFVSPAILDMNPSDTLLAKDLTPLRKRKAKGPQLVRKKLHWVPIKGRIEATIWAGPPGDLLKAAGQLIDDEAEFARLFIQRPEDARKKKKRDDGGVVQLLDQRRAMNAGIALAKLKVPTAGVVACLGSMSARSPDGKHLLTLVELQNLRGLCPSDEEVKLVQGYKGDAARLGAPEQFFLAVAGVPQARPRAEGLFYQASFDERVREAHSRLGVFNAAIGQLSRAGRLQRLLKAVLVLGNKMNGVADRKRLVKAFTLNSLHQLHLTKAWDQSTSVLQYLIRLLQRKDPDLLRLARDFKGPTLAEAKRLPLDVMTEEMRELRSGLTALESLVREAAQAGGGWSGMRSSSAAGGGGGPGGEQFVEEEVEGDGAGAPAKEQGGGGGGGGTAHAASASSDASGAAAADGKPPATTAAATSAASSQQHHKKRRKTVRRRVEPLPDFASVAQAELGRLQSAFDQAQADYKALVKFFKEDADTPADELFGTLHSFLQAFDSTLRAMIDKKRKERDARRRAKEAEATKKRAARRQRAGADGGADEDEDADGSSGGGSGAAPAARRGHKASLSSELTLSTRGSASSDDDADGGGGGGKSRHRPGWQDDAPADGGAISEADEEDDEEDAAAAAAQRSTTARPAVAASGAPAGDSRGALLGGIRAGRPAAVAGRPAETSSGGGGGGGKAGGGGGGDPRAGLLAAIAKRGGAAAAVAAPAPAPDARKAEPGAPATGGGSEGGDPRAALMAMLAKRRVE